VPAGGQAERAEPGPVQRRPGSRPAVGVAPVGDRGHPGRCRVDRDPAGEFQAGEVVRAVGVG
jgi:hypothetical protein